MDGDDDSPIMERPLTEAEITCLRGSLKKPPAGILRLFGAFLGIMPLFLMGLAAAGTPFEPLNYVVITLFCGIFGAALGSASKNLRTPVVKAVTGGIAKELSGVPEVQKTQRSIMATVELGGITLKMPSLHAKKLLPGRMNRLVYAEGGQTTGPGRKQGLRVALVLNWNGGASKRPNRCYLVDPSATKEGTPKSRWGPKAARGGQR